MQDRDEGPPRFCVKCGAEFDADTEAVPGTHAIGGSAMAVATDLTYRQLEQTSAARAAEFDAPSLKVTDLNDNLREGDVAAKRLPVSPQFTQFERDRASSGLPPFTAWGGGFATPGVRVAPVIPSASPGAAFAGPGHIAIAAAQPEHEHRVIEAKAATSYKPALERGDVRKFPLRKR